MLLLGGLHAAPRLDEGRAYEMQLTVTRMILVRMMLRISFTWIILIVVMITTVQLQYGGTGYVWGSGSAPRREYDDADPLQEENIMFRIRSIR